ncbi:hypothetical protein IW262DRAFT_1462208 [Armillaria fumosa]|nr:hypothetical protein IW262DRAFT_1462208 [Armillaria fumosa]
MIVNWDCDLLLPLGMNAWRVHDYFVIVSPAFPSLSVTKALWTALVEPFPDSSFHRALVTAGRRVLVQSTFDTSLHPHDPEQMVSIHNWLADTFTAMAASQGVKAPGKDTCELESPPVSLCHIDVNHRNILVDNGKHICGLMDWEHAILLPLAMNAWRIRFLSVTIAAHKRAVLTAMQTGLAIIHHFGDYFVSRIQMQEFADIFDWFDVTIQ